MPRDNLNETGKFFEKHKLTKVTQEEQKSE